MTKPSKIQIWEKITYIVYIVLYYIIIILHNMLEIFYLE